MSKWFIRKMSKCSLMTLIFYACMIMWSLVLVKKVSSNEAPATTEEHVQEYIPKVFVYNVPDNLLLNGVPPTWTSPDGLCRSDPGYTVEVDFINFFKATGTENPDEADFFVIPQYATCVYHNALEKGALHTAAMMATDKYLKAILTQVSHDSPFYSKKQGTDHILVTGHDIIHGRLRTLFATIIMNMIVISPHGDLADPKYIHGRDIVCIPLERRLEFLSPQTVPWKERRYLFYFRGSYHYDDLRYSHGVRQYIGTHFMNSSKVLVKAGGTSSANYRIEMSQSRYCLSLRGWVPWSGRIGTILTSGCVPVIISDLLVLPMEEIYDYKRFTVKLWENETRDIFSTLAKISIEHGMSKEAYLNQINKSLRYNDPPIPNDAFYQILKVLKKRMLSGSPLGTMRWL